MESIDSLIKQLAEYEDGLPPIAQWHPTQFGHSDMVIRDNGTWLHQGVEISRLSLVKLFASILVQENQRYFLITPVEKLEVDVEDAPFVVVDWQWLDSIQARTLSVTTNVGQQILLTYQQQLVLKEDMIYVVAQRGLLAKLNRNVYYQWLESARERSTGSVNELILMSNGHPLRIGQYSLK